MISDKEKIVQLEAQLREQDIMYRTRITHIKDDLQRLESTVSNLITEDILPNLEYAIYALNKGRPDPAIAAFKVRSAMMAALDVRPASQAACYGSFEECFNVIEKMAP